MADQSTVRGIFAGLFRGLRDELKAKSSESNPATVKGFATRLGMNLLADAAGEVGTIVSKLVCSVCGKPATGRLLRYTHENGTKEHFYFCDDCAEKCPDSKNVEKLPTP